ncbi:MAG: hypothetical protein SFT92_05505 [Rickettsiales bacterium]|nr:hypothetical protein [Rickettsiales bacterium]
MDALSQYYIDYDGVKKGPFDPVTIIRRIRMGKILPDTAIYVGENEVAERAGSVVELADFFTGGGDTSKLRSEDNLPDLSRLFHLGWHFTTEYSVMTVYAGVMLLISLFIAYICSRFLGNIAGGVIAFIFFMMLHSMYMVFILRMYRGQVVSSDFINRRVSPILATLAIATCLWSVLILAGSALFILPGMIMLVCFIFLPFYLVDFHHSLPEAFRACLSKYRKSSKTYSILLAVVVLLHLLCVILILPAPLSIPIFSAALAELYEHS